MYLKDNKMKSIIFICLGNICRSSLAEGIAKKQAKDRELKLRIESAGLSRYHNGEAPCDKSQLLASQYGIDISQQRSQHVSEFDLDTFDLVVAMDESNFMELKSLGVINLVKLGDYGFDGEDVADIYYYPKQAEYVYDMLDTSIKKILLVYES